MNDVIEIWKTECFALKGVTRQSRTEFEKTRTEEINSGKDEFLVEI